MNTVFDGNGIAPDKALFSGMKPWYYDQFLGPVFFQPYALEIAERIKPFTEIRMVLELSCGTGRATSLIRKAMPSGAMLIASDISAEMLAIAKQRVTDRSIDWELIDGQQLPLLDKSIDIVVCSFGYMFMEDKSKAFSEAFRALRPGGILIFIAWDKLEYNPIQRNFRKVVADYFKEALEEKYNKAFSFNNDEEIRYLLVKAGFSSVSIERVEKKAVSSSARDIAIGMIYANSLYDEIMKRCPELLNEIIDVTEYRIAERYGKAPMVAPMKALICISKKNKHVNSCREESKMYNY